jgi:hypothetical protein
LGRLNIDLLQTNKRLQLNIHACTGVYSIFTSRAYQATTPGVAFPQESRASLNSSAQTSTENALIPWPLDVRYTSGSEIVLEPFVETDSIRPGAWILLSPFRLGG